MKFPIILCCLSILLACQSQTTKKPPQLIEKEKMSRLLEDVLLMESYYQSKHGIPGVYKDALDESLSGVFKKHQVTKSQFKDSYTYYASQTEEFIELNTSIMDRLSRQVP